ncbi:MAG: CBS domain-containing membrane protein [Porticoccaceae bacterium]|jgi:CBS domain-containing membrane protein
MKKNVPVSDSMTKSITRLNLSVELTKAEELFKKYKIRRVTVVDVSKIRGMMTYMDLLRVSYAPTPKKKIKWSPLCSICLPYDRYWQKK